MNLVSAESPGSRYTNTEQEAQHETLGFTVMSLVYLS